MGLGGRQTWEDGRRPRGVETGADGMGCCDQLRLTPSTGTLHRSGGCPWRAGSAGPGGKSG